MLWLQPILNAPRRTTLQSLTAALFFSTEVGVATASITGLYALVARSHPKAAGGVTWAIVSAVLVLYPGITQSLAAALLRIAANLLGSGIGFLVGYFVGTDTPELILALIGTIVAGELLRMDLALRTACVAAVIVMSANEHHVGTSVVERLISVAVGCAAALVIQVAARPLRRFLPFVVDVEVGPAKKTPANAAE